MQRWFENMKSVMDIDGAMQHGAISSKGWRKESLKQHKDSLGIFRKLGSVGNSHGRAKCKGPNKLVSSPTSKTNTMQARLYQIKMIFFIHKNWNLNIKYL